MSILENHPDEIPQKVAVVGKKVENYVTKFNYYGGILTLGNHQFQCPCPLL